MSGEEIYFYQISVLNIADTSALKENSRAMVTRWDETTARQTGKEHLKAPEFRVYILMHIQHSHRHAGKCTFTVHKLS